MGCPPAVHRWVPSFVLGAYTLSLLLHFMLFTAQLLIVADVLVISLQVVEELMSITDGQVVLRPQRDAGKPAGTCLGPAGLVGGRLGVHLHSQPGRHGG